MSTVSPVDQDDFSRGGRPKRVGLLFVSAHLRAGPFLVPSAVEGAREGAAGDKFRVSGTKEMVEWAGANKESGGCFAH